MKRPHGASSTRAITSLALALLLTTAASYLALPRTTGDAEVAAVLRRFEGKTLADWIRFFDSARPQAVTGEEKLLLRQAGFPLVNSETEVTAAADVSRLYGRSRRVLEFHKRAGVVEFIIFRHSHPVVMNKAGAYIALATRTLEIAKDEEGLAGVIAHELSHEYVAREMYDARREGDDAKLRELELLCEAFTVATLVHLRMDPAAYARVLTKIIRHSRESRRLNDGSRGMPSLEARLKVIAAVERMLTQPPQVGDSRRATGHNPVASPAKRPPPPAAAGHNGTT